jgi:hypothetical protein
MSGTIKGAENADKLQIGQTLKQQIAICTHPHAYTGMIYSIESELHMFCQVGYAKFVFISLETGNRILNPIQTECDTTSCEYGHIVEKSLDGCALLELMGVMAEQLVREGACNSITDIVCAGRIKETPTGINLL